MVLPRYIQRPCGRNCKRHTVTTGEIAQIFPRESTAMFLQTRLYIFFLILFLGACATPEYQQARSQCDGEGLNLYPVVQQPQVFRRSRIVQVPDGSTVCETQSVQNKEKRTEVSSVRSVCRPGMRPVTEYYDETVMVDVNRGARDAHVDQCARTLCLQRYGNLKCKV